MNPSFRMWPVRISLFLCVGFLEVSGFTSNFRPSGGCGPMPCPGQFPTNCGQRPCKPIPQNPWIQQPQFPPMFPVRPYGSHYKANQTSTTQTTTTTTTTTTSTASVLQCVRDGNGICSRACDVDGFPTPNNTFFCGFQNEVCCVPL